MASICIAHLFHSAFGSTPVEITCQANDTDGARRRRVREWLVCEPMCIGVVGMVLVYILDEGEKEERRQPREESKEGRRRGRKKKDD